MWKIFLILFVATVSAHGAATITLPSTGSGGSATNVSGGTFSNVTLTGSSTVPTATTASNLIQGTTVNPLASVTATNLSVPVGFSLSDGAFLIFRVDALTGGDVTPAQNSLDFQTARTDNYRTATTGNAILWGGNNTADSVFGDAVIVNGSGNTNQGNDTTIAAGGANFTEGVDSFIGAGVRNFQSASESFLGAGADNSQRDITHGAFLGAGSDNTQYGNDSTIVGGIGNTTGGTGHHAIGSYIARTNNFEVVLGYRTNVLSIKTNGTASFEGDLVLHVGGSTFTSNSWTNNAGSDNVVIVSSTNGPSGTPQIDMTQNDGGLFDMQLNIGGLHFRSFGTDVVTVDGSSGAITAASFTGSGAGLTNLNVSTAFTNGTTGMTGSAIVLKTAPTINGITVTNTGIEVASFRSTAAFSLSTFYVGAALKGYFGTDANGFVMLAANGSSYNVQVNDSSGVMTLRASLAATNGVILPNTTIALAADDQIVGASTNATIILSSNDGTAGNRTFVLTTAVPNKTITLIWSGTNAGEIVDDAANSGSGNVRLSATWTPTQYDTLRLIGVGNDWHEISRSTN